MPYAGGSGQRAADPQLDWYEVSCISLASQTVVHRAVLSAPDVPVQSLRQSRLKRSGYDRQNSALSAGAGSADGAAEVDGTGGVEDPTGLAEVRAGA